jgi:hypothetical protein
MTIIDIARALTEQLTNSQQPDAEAVIAAD